MAAPGPPSPAEILGRYNLQDCVEDFVVGNHVGDRNAEGDAAVARVRSKGQAGFLVRKHGRIGVELPPSWTETDSFVSLAGTRESWG